MTRDVLCLNSGSSSLKVALFAVDAEHEHAVERKTIDRIGSGRFSHSAAVEQGIGACGARVGLRRASWHTGSCSAETGTVSRPASTGVSWRHLRALVPFAPLHLPPEIEAIEAVARRWPAVAQVACFDTAFHATMPEVAWRYALPSTIESRHPPLRLSRALVRICRRGARSGRARPCRRVPPRKRCERDGRQRRRVNRHEHGAHPDGRPRDGDASRRPRPRGRRPPVAGHGYDAERLGQLFEREWGYRAISETSADVRELSPSD